MPDLFAETYAPLLAAAGFAARAHRQQLRKDGETPYIAHPFRVCLIVRHVFGIADPEMLTAALLHDTVEDTTTDRDDLIERFGPKVAGWVAALSKDKRLADEEREAAYIQTLKNSPDEVKICKLADLFDNLLDSGHLSDKQRKRTLKRSTAYLDALASQLPESARAAYETVRKLHEEMHKKAK
jgi:(p)ppGpp synthase/HD superfamily hydrolase